MKLKKRAIKLRAPQLIEEGDTCQSSNSSSDVCYTFERNDNGCVRSEKVGNILCDNQSKLTTEESKASIQPIWNCDINRMQHLPVECPITGTSDCSIYCTRTYDETDQMIDSIQPCERSPIKGKDPAPPGYKITLILPQHTSIKDFQQCEECIQDTSSTETCDGELDDKDNIVHLLTIPEISWDALQCGVIQEIPEKYTSSFDRCERDDKSLLSHTSCCNDNCNVQHTSFCTECYTDVSKDEVKILLTFSYFPLQLQGNF